jgi:hypothetical protein
VGRPNLQEAHTRAVRAALAAGLPSLPHASWRPGGLAGPAGGLVTFSRRPAAGVSFHPFPGRHHRRAEPRRAVRLERRKGMLVTTVAGDTFVNVHLSPNHDGDWSPGSGLADAFGDRAPATFHPELLRPGQQSHAIDHLLFRAGQGGARVTASELAFREKETFGGRPAFLSDHAGLLVRLEL